MLSACRNCPRSTCHPSTRGSTRSLLRVLCTAFTMAFFTESKKAWDWMSNGSLQSHLLAAFSSPSLACGGQPVITYFCVDKLSELQISLVGELSSAITLILMRRAWNSHSAETSETDFCHGRADWLRLSTNKLFSRGDSTQHTWNVKIRFIYLLFF